jgi:hypothetical protein
LTIIAIIIIMLLQKTPLLLLLWMAIIATTVPLVNSQFACTLSAPPDENACIKSVGDDQDHCAWCSLSGFGFCVSETQAETFEQSIPGVECDRYSGDDDDDAAVVDDDAAVADDDAAANDDATEDDDGGIAPTDDAIPSDFWTCLQAKDETSCGKDAGCTWCMAKAGFGLCMAGPTADSAANSDWFTCAVATESAGTMTTQEEEQDPYDPACITAYLQDPTQAGCEAAADEDGNPCEWCNLAGMADVCLTAEQASAGSQLGLTCDDNTSTITALRTREE